MKRYIAVCSAGPMNDYQFLARSDEEALAAFRTDYEELPQHWEFTIYELREVGEVHAGIS